MLACTLEGHVRRYENSIGFLALGDQAHSRLNGADDRVKSALPLMNQERDKEYQLYEIFRTVDERPIAMPG